LNSPHVIPLRINDDQNECVSFRVRRVAFRIRIRCCSNDDALSLLSSSSRSEADDSSGDDMATRYRTMAQSNVVMHLTRRIMRERPESVGPSASYRTQFQCGRDAEDTAEGHFRTRPGSRKLTYAHDLEIKDRHGVRCRVLVAKRLQSAAARTASACVLCVVPDSSSSCPLSSDPSDNP